MACVDTSGILDLAGRGGKRLKRLIQNKLLDLARRGERVTTTRLTIAELYVGIHKARDPHAEEVRIAEVLQDFQVLEFTSQAARRFGRAVAHLHRIGRPVGDMDVLIAATTLAAGEYLITRDASHFADIPGLEVEEY